MDRLYRSKEAKKGEAALSSKDLSLYANALWMQGRYAESVKILESAKPEYPQSRRALCEDAAGIGVGANRAERKGADRGQKTLGSRAPLPAILSFLLSGQAHPGFGDAG